MVSGPFMHIGDNFNYLEIAPFRYPITSSEQLYLSSPPQFTFSLQLKEFVVVQATVKDRESRQRQIWWENHFQKSSWTQKLETIQMSKARTGLWRMEQGLHLKLISRLGRKLPRGAGAVLFSLFTSSCTQTGLLPPFKLKSYSGKWFHMTLPRVCLSHDTK